MKPVGMCRHVPRRDRHRPRPGAAAGLHDRRAPRTWRSTPSRAGHQEGPGRRPRVPAHQPPARLPGLRQGRRVPAAGPDDGLRPGREPLRRGEAALREADPDQRPRLPRPRALHPLRPLHPLRQGGGRRPADPLPWTAATRPRSTPSPTTRSRRTSAATPCRSARSARSPPTPYRFKARPWDLDQVESTCHDLLRRLPHRRAVVAQRGAALPRRRHRPGQLGLAVRQGPLRLRGGQQRGPPRRPAAARDGGELDRRSRWADALRAGRRAPLPATPARRPRSASSAAPGSPTRTPTPGPSWPRASSAPTTSTPSSATACRPRSCSACPGPRSTRSAPRAARSLLLGPDLKEELPVLYLRLRHAVVERRRHARRAHAAAHRPSSDLAARHAAAPARRRAASSCRRCSPAARRPRGRRHRRRRRRRRRGPPGRRPVTVVLGPGRRSPRRRRRRRRRRRHPRRPPRGPVPAAPCAAATCTAPSTWASPPGCCPAGSTLDAGRTWFRDRGWATVPAEPRPRRHRHPQAAADGRIDVLVLLGADPLADFPDRDLADRGPGRGPHGHRRRPVPHRPPPHRPTSCSPAAGPPRSTARTTNIEGRVSPSPRRSRRPAPPAPTG